MKPERFEDQIKALESLTEEGVDCFPAVITSFSSKDKIKKLRQRLKEIRPDFEDFEKEELILYPFVQDNLKKAGLSCSELGTPCLPAGRRTPH
jgi:hypothetical protein